MLSKYMLGYLGEILVIFFLRITGHRILVHRYRCTRGEIDIIALKDTYLIFVEVKTSICSQEIPILTKQKQSIVKSAKHFLLTHNKYQLLDVRFDFCFISALQKPLYIRNAWDEEICQYKSFL